MADLRRMDPSAPDKAVFWRLLAQYDLLGNPIVESKWALILHGIALMTPTSSGDGVAPTAHDGSVAVGRALFLGGDSQRTTAFYSETRLNRLLTARGPILRTLLARTFPDARLRRHVLQLARDGAVHPKGGLRRRRGGVGPPPASPAPTIRRSDEAPKLRTTTTSPTEGQTRKEICHVHAKIPSDPHIALLPGRAAEPRR